MEPRLSVIMPAWNAETTIEAALASVRAETEVPLECIVVDDASTDGTTSIVEAIAAADPRVRLVRAPENGARPLPATSRSRSPGAPGSPSSTPTTGSCRAGSAR